MDYAERTNALARKLGIKIEDLPQVIGISRASLFNYRGDNEKVTKKAWAKLESAERDAGLVSVYDGSGEGNAARVKEGQVYTDDVVRRLERLEEQMAELNRLMVTLSNQMIASSKKSGCVSLNAP